MIGKMIICCLLFSLNAAAQKQDIDSVSTQGSKSSLMDKLRQVQQYLDDKAKKKAPLRRVFPIGSHMVPVIVRLFGHQ